jgi:hypothetical protein
MMLKNPFFAKQVFPYCVGGGQIGVSEVGRNVVGSGRKEEGLGAGEQSQNLTHR